MSWITREHWYWGLVLPGRVPILFIFMGTLLMITPSIWTMFLGLCLIGMGLAAFLGIFWHWHAFSLSFPASGGFLLERNARHLLMERRIGLSVVGNFTFEQTLAGRFFDYGTLTIGALGGPYQWENLGGFRTLRRIIDSQGTWMPPPANPLTSGIRRVAGSALRRLHSIWESLTQILQGLGQEVRTIGRRLTTPSYRRFVEFAESILFPQSSHAFEDASFETHFTREEIRLYERILQLRRLLVSDQQGRTGRHKRIRTYRDIRRHVPPSWFRKAMRAA